MSNLQKTWNESGVVSTQIDENGIPEFNVKEVNILFLDMSSTCTGYSLVNVNFETKKANFINCGAIWFNKDFNNQDKYHYLFCAITNYFNIIGKIDFCVAEAYMMNMKRAMGCQVGPELHGVLQVALAEIGVKYMVIPVQTWRKFLGVKKDWTGDYKKPTLDKVTEYVKIPESIISNITGSERRTPNDIADSLGISIGTLKKWGINNLNFNSLKFQERIDL